MKAKLFVLAALAVVGLTMNVAPASAWHWHRNRTVIICHPYNAFSEGCTGHGRFHCVGCCPFPGQHQSGGGDACFGWDGADVAGLGGVPAGYALGQPGAMYPGMPVTAPIAPQQSAPPGQQFTPPQPMPSNTQTMVPMAPPVLPASHRAYAPVYYPLMPMSYPGQQVPSYWYGN